MGYRGVMPLYGSLITRALYLTNRRLAIPTPSSSQAKHLINMSAMPPSQQASNPPTPQAPRPSPITPLQPRFSPGADEVQLANEATALLQCQWTLDEEQMGVQKTFVFPTYAKALVCN